jgi:hypothetical protein
MSLSTTGGGTRSKGSEVDAIGTGEGILLTPNSPAKESSENPEELAAVAAVLEGS